jgi:hypothetical protein
MAKRLKINASFEDALAAILKVPPPPKAKPLTPAQARRKRASAARKRR